MLRKTMLCGVFILQCVIANAQLDANKINNLKIAPNANKVESARLLKDFYNLEATNDSLNELTNSLISKNQQLSDQLNFVYIRDQISSQTFGFLKDGVVLPAFRELITVHKDGAGNILHIAIQYTGNDKDNFISALFTPNKDMEIGAPKLYNALISNNISFVIKVPEQLVKMQIKRTKYPYLVAVSGSVAEMKKQSAALLNFIHEVGVQNCCGFYEAYLEIENAKLGKTPNLSDLLDYRIYFLTKLKSSYEKQMKLR